MEYITIYIFSIILWKMQVESLVVFPDRYYSYMMPGTNIFTSTKRGWEKTNDFQLLKK